MALTKIRQEQGVVINEGSTDVDFRVESDTGTHALFVQGSDGNVGIGTSSPLDALHIKSAVTTDYRGNVFVEDTTAMAAGVGGQITFGGKYKADGSTTEWSGIQGTKANGSDDYSGQIEFKTRKQGAALQTKMTLDADGNVGIGTSSPSTMLHIESSSGNASAQLTSGTSGTSYINMGDTGNVDAGQVSYINNGDAMAFTANAAERMRIDSSGTLLVGKASDTFATVGTSIFDHGEVQVTRAGSVPLYLRRNTNSGTILEFRKDATAVGTISVDSDSTAYNTSSDYRLKENVDYTWDATTRLKQLKPARFNFIADDTNTLVDGFIAHEVSSIVPEAITGAKDAVDADNNPEYQGIDQSKLVPLLVKTIQELEARITALE